jgi:predicted ATPase
MHRLPNIAFNFYITTKKTVYTVIDEQEKKTVHIQMRRLLLANTSKTQQSDKIFK